MTVPPEAIDAAAEAMVARSVFPVDAKHVRGLAAAALEAAGLPDAGDRLAAVGGHAMTVSGHEPGDPAQQDAPHMRGRPKPGEVTSVRFPPSQHAAARNAAAAEQLNITEWMRKIVAEEIGRRDGRCAACGQPGPAAAAERDRADQLAALADAVIASYQQVSDGYRGRVGIMQIRKWQATLNGLNTVPERQ